jgi:LmbE family N-acetylglucosaminyl deacetylase
MSKILFCTAHPDDLEFSAGATLSGLIKENHEISVHVFSTSESIYGNEGIIDEVKHSISDIYHLDLIVHRFPTMHFREHYQEIRDIVFKIKEDFIPDDVYCTSPNSLHPDHQVIGEACESIFLESSIFALENIRDGHNQKVNKWNSVTESDLDTKLLALNCYHSQKRRSYHDTKVVESIARFRGSQIGVEFAEAFEVIRVVT